MIKSLFCCYLYAVLCSDLVIQSTKFWMIYSQCHLTAGTMTLVALFCSKFPVYPRSRHQPGLVLKYLPGGRHVLHLFVYLTYQWLANFESGLMKAWIIGLYIWCTVTWSANCSVPRRAMSCWFVSEGRSGHQRQVYLVRLFCSLWKPLCLFLDVLLLTATKH